MHAHAVSLRVRMTIAIAALGLAVVSLPTYPGIDHVGVATAGEADALAFFQQMLPPHS